MKIELIKYPTEEDWIEVKRRALVTVGKAPVKEPDLQWKHSILEARHSPIRYLRFSFMLTDIPYYTSVHLCRHIHAQPYVRSQRNDRQAMYDRNSARQDAPVSMIWDINAEELMVIANKRLCSQADITTRMVVGGMCDLVKAEFPEFADLLVPMCDYTGSCHEMKSCGRKPSAIKAEWIDAGSNLFKCTNCGILTPHLSAKQTYLFCPNCGARMEDGKK